MALISRLDPRDVRWPAIVLAIAAAGGAAAALAPTTTLQLAAAAAGIVAALRVRAARWSVVAGTLTYVLVLEWTYVELISSIYVNYGFAYSPPRWWELLGMVALAWVPSLLMPVTLRLMSHAVIWALYVTVYVPATIVTFHLYGLTPVLHLPLLVSMMLLAVGERLPRFGIVRLGLSPVAHRRVLLALAATGIAYIAIRFGVSFDLPNPQDVTDTRAEYKSGREPGSFAAYAVPWLGRAIFPFALLVGLRDRTWALVAIATIGSLLVYSTAGFRSALLVPILSVAAFLVVRRGKDARVVPWSLAALVAVSGWLATIGATAFLSLLVRRPIMLPGQLTGFYFDWFSDAPTFQLRHSVLSFLGPSPYPAGQTPADVIGDAYLRGSHANANLWADAMANFGVAGMLIFTLLLIVGLWIADLLTMHHSPAILVAIGAIAGFTFANTGLLTGSLSAGVGVLVLLTIIGRSSPSSSRDPADRGPVTSPT